MSDTPVALSVLLTSHAEVEELEEIVASFLDFRLPDCELIYIHDSEELNTLNRIGELRTDDSVTPLRILKNKRICGRAESLNRAVTHASGRYFWAPLRAGRANRIVFQECLRRMKTDPAGCWVLDQHLPENGLEWYRQLIEGRLPADEQLLFNRSALPAGEPVFRHGFTPHTAGELAWRVSRDKPSASLDSFFVLARSGHPSPRREKIREWLFSLIRSASDEEERLALVEELRELPQSPDTEAELDSWLERASSLMEEDPRSSLDQVNRYLKENPDELDALKLKVQLLERLRRHVEAAELKHLLQKRQEPPAETQPETPEQPTLFDLSGNPESSADLDSAATGSATEAPADEPSSHEADSTPETSIGESTSGISETVTDPARKAQMPESTPSESESDPSANTPAANHQPSFRHSILIPTTGDGKPALEECLIRLDELCDASVTELIVIDNASIDDTFDYLEDLQENGFLHLQVITNPENRGFGASINQAMELARGQYLLIMHNDLLPEDGMIEELTGILENEPAIGLIGPAVNRCDHPDQTFEALGEEIARIVITDRIDSCCMMARRDIPARFNEAYGLALFDDDDFCNQVRRHGLDVAVAPRAHAAHRHRITTESMGLLLEPVLRWTNSDIYHARWHSSPDLTIPTGTTFSEQLSSTPLPINPLNPPGYWLDQVDQILDDERKTRIEREGIDDDDDDLIRLIRILLIADKRDFLRLMESRMENRNLSPPLDLLKLLVRFYYDRNIYSRCRLYLEKPGTDGDYFDLYRLRIAVKEKETDLAIGLLNSLMEKYPCHPDLYRMAGDLYIQSGDAKEAESFYRLARQLMPEGDAEIEAFEIKY